MLYARILTSILTFWIAQSIALPALPETEGALFLLKALIDPTKTALVPRDGPSGAGASNSPAPSSTSPPPATSQVPTPKTECLAKASNFRKIYLVNASTPDTSPFYAITTQWTVHYPAQLQKAFQDVGFEIISLGGYNANKSYSRVISSCGWTGHGTYSYLSVRRGKLDLIGTSQYPIGDPFELTKIVAVLRSTYPFTEITLILGFLMGIPISFFGLCFCIGYDESGTIDREERLKKKREKLREKRQGEKAMVVAESEKLPFYPPTIGESLLLNLPPELHLEILSHLHYQEKKITRATCRYLHGLIPTKDLPRFLGDWSEYLLDREMSRKVYPEIACFTCLQLKPPDQFPLIEQTKQQTVNSWNGPVPLLPESSLNRHRKCIPCTIAAAHYTDGVAPFQVSKSDWIFVCGACWISPRYSQEAQDSPVPQHHAMKGSGIWCNECYENCKRIHAHSWLRWMQALVTLVVFSVAFTGIIPNLLTPWAFHITLCLLTMGSCLNSCIMRGSEPAETGYLHYGTKRDILGTLLWAGMTAAWMWEIIYLDWSQWGAANLVVLLVLCYIEILLFVFSCYRDFAWMKYFRAYRKKQKELP